MYKVAIIQQVHMLDSCDKYFKRKERIAMKRRVGVLLICLIMLFSTFSITALACGDCVAVYPAKSAMVISSDGINLRRQHSTSSDILGVLNYGDTMSIDIERENYDAWYHGTVTYTTNPGALGLVGWGSATYLKMLS